MKKIIVSAFIAAAAFAVMAGPASAHHAEVSASAKCANGAFDITVTTEAWATDDAARRHNNGISVQLMQHNRVLVAFGGTFTADNDYRFSGTFTSVAAGTYQVRAISTRPWGPNEEFGSELESRTITVTTPDVPCGGEYNQRPLPTIAKPAPQPEVPTSTTVVTAVGSSTVVEREAPAAQVAAPATLAFTGRTTNTLLALAAALMFVGAMTVLAGGKIRR